MFFLDRRSDGMDPTTYRGTITKVYKDPHNTDYVCVLPVGAQNLPPGEYPVGYDLTWRVPMANVFIDWWGLKPQYDVNEEVLCRIGHKWVAASVAYYWPIHEITRLPTRFQDEMHFYKCVVKDQEGVDRYHVVCLHDDERCIMEYPKSFRFKRGDKVFFATANAEEIPEQPLDGGNCHSYSRLGRRRVLCRL